MPESKTKKAKPKSKPPQGVIAKRQQQAKRAAQKAKRGAANLAELSTVEYKTQKLAELRGDIEMCRHTGRVTALAQLHRIEMQTQEELEHCKRAEADPIETMTAPELLAFIQGIVLELPQSLQDQLSATLGAVRSRNVVRLDTPPHPDQDRKAVAPGTKTRGSR
tara:strand:- start:518 stop:1009 length:492 start_codon:yes stop_codon:yes gene_type:complete